MPDLTRRSMLGWAAKALGVGAAVAVGVPMPALPSTYLIGWDAGEPGGDQTVAHLYRGTGDGVEFMQAMGRRTTDLLFYGSEPATAAERKLVAEFQGV